MKKNIRTIILLASLIGGTLCGCKKHTPVTSEEGTAVALRAERRSETGNETWNENDAVGVFMLRSGGKLPADLLAGMYNIPYTITDPAQGTLATTGTVYWPEEESVDLIAYAPYSATEEERLSDEGIYTVDVKDQSVPEAIDILYARTTGVTPSEEPVTLAFSHLLSRITFHVRAGIGMLPETISALTEADVTIAGMPTAATLWLNDGIMAATETLPFSPKKVAAEDADASFSALIIPHAGNSTRTVTFRLGDQETAWPMDAISFEAGKQYAYPMSINAEGVIDVGSPTITDWTVNDHPQESMPEPIPDTPSAQRL